MLFRSLAGFEDKQHGGFYFTSHDHEKLIHRAKPAYDNATPSGNGVAAFALQRLGHLIGEPRYIAAAERALRLFAQPLATQPSACVSLATALEEAMTPPRSIVLRCDTNLLQEWQRALNARYRPETLVFALPGELAGLPPAFDKPVPGSGVNAYVCQGVSCLPPVSELGTIERLLQTA